MNILYSLQHLGFTIPPQADSAWMGEAGPGPSYREAGSGGPENEFTNRNTTFLTLREEPRLAAGLLDTTGAASWLLQPLLDLVLVFLHPVSAGLLGILLVAGDRLRDELLILVGQLHLLQHVVRRRAAVRELLREQLVDHRDVVLALVLLGVAALLGVVLAVLVRLGTRRQLHLSQVVLLVKVLRRVPVEDDRLLLLVELAPARHLSRLRPGGHVLEVQVESLDQLLVLLDVGGVASEEHALVAGLGGLEQILLALQALPGLELGMLVHQVLGDEPADVTLDSERSTLDHGAGLVDVLRVLVRVLPVLEHGVHLAVRHGLEHRDLGDLGHLDLTAELVLEHGLGDVRVGRRARPSLLVQHHLAAVLAGRRAATAAAVRRLVVLLLTAGRHGQREYKRHHDRPNAPTAQSRVRHQTAPPPGCTCRLFLPKPNSGPPLERSVVVARWPCVTRSSAIPSARIASDAMTPSPNSLRWSPRATMSPSAPDPTSPPITTTARTMMMPWFTPSMMLSRASGSLTFASTCVRDAPKACAASTAAGGTLRMPAVTSRMITGIAYSTDATTPGTR